MRMEMTVRDLINNPPGPNSRQVAARYTIRDALRAKFVAAMQDPARRRKFGVQVSKRGEGYIVWVKVPSEKYDVIYDVILQLSFPEGARALASADVKVYCNSPSWLYVQGYVFNKNGFLADGWAQALGRAATEPPDTVNASQDIGFDRLSTRASCSRPALADSSLRQTSSGRPAGRPQTRAIRSSRPRPSSLSTTGRRTSTPRLPES